MPLPLLRNGGGSIVNIASMSGTIANRGLTQAHYNASQAGTRRGATAAPTSRTHRPSGSVSELLPQTLSWGMLLGEQKTRELIGVRHGLEVQAARLAAITITDQGLADLAEHLASMRTSTRRFDEFVVADMRFHQEIAAAADNDLLDEMLQSVRSLIRVWVERALKDSDHAELTCREHEAILLAVQVRDPQAAADAMSSHMDSAARRLTAAFDWPHTP